MLTVETRAAEPLLQTVFEEKHPRLSPDGRWLAYDSDESGRFEVYLRRFPDVHDGKWQLSTAGGELPVWNPRGGELFYLRENQLVAVSLSTDPTPRAFASTVLFSGGPYGLGAPADSFDVSADGQRFLMLRKTESKERGNELVVVENWFQELLRLAPSGG